MIKKGVKVNGLNKNGDLIFHAMTAAPFAAPGKMNFLHDRIWTDAEFQAYQERERRTVDLLVTAGVDINGRSGPESDTPLMLAAHRGHLEMARALIAHGADISLKDANGETAASLAKMYGHPEFLPLLEAKPPGTTPGDAPNPAAQTPPPQTNSNGAPSNKITGIQPPDTTSIGDPTNAHDSASAKADAVATVSPPPAATDASQMPQTYLEVNYFETSGDFIGFGAAQIPRQTEESFLQHFKSIPEGLHDFPLKSGMNTLKDKTPSGIDYTIILDWNGPSANKPQDISLFPKWVKVNADPETAPHFPGFQISLAQGNDIMVVGTHTHAMLMLIRFTDHPSGQPTDAAAKQGDTAEFERLPKLEAKLDVASFGTDTGLMSPLAATANSGQVSDAEVHPIIAPFLWGRGNRAASPLLFAISREASIEDIAKLLSQGSPADPPQDEFLTPLGAAALAGNMDAVKLLIAHGAEVNKGGYRFTPLRMAASEGQDEIILYLLNHGATPVPAAICAAAWNSYPYEGQRSKDHFEKTVQILIDAGALKTVTPDWAGSILAAPIGTRQGPPNAAVLKMLLDAGISPESPMPFIVENGEKPNSVIGYYRELYQKNKADPVYADKAAALKPLLDMLEAAEKGTSRLYRTSWSVMGPRK
jgi:hypothetical protein